MDKATDTAPAIHLVALGTIRDEAAFRDYAAQATPLLEQAGGRLIGRQRITGAVEASDAPGIVFTMAVESEAAIRDAFTSPAYRQLIPTRERAFARLDLWLGPMS